MYYFTWLASPKRAPLQSAQTGSRILAPAKQAQQQSPLGFRSSNEEYQDVTKDSLDYPSSGLRRTRNQARTCNTWDGFCTKWTLVRNTLTSTSTGAVLHNASGALRQQGWKNVEECVPSVGNLHTTRVQIQCTVLPPHTQEMRNARKHAPANPETSEHKDSNGRSSSSTTQRVCCRDCGAAAAATGRNGQSSPGTHRANRRLQG